VARLQTFAGHDKSSKILTERSTIALLEQKLYRLMFMVFVRSAAPLESKAGDLSANFQMTI
jgi:hypothetical protein